MERRSWKVAGPKRKMTRLPLHLAANRESSMTNDCPTESRPRRRPMLAWAILPSVARPGGKLAADSLNRGRRSARRTRRPLRVGPVDLGMCWGHKRPEAGATSGELDQESMGEGAIVISPDRNHTPSAGKDCIGHDYLADFPESMQPQHGHQTSSEPQRSPTRRRPDHSCSKQVPRVPRRLAPNTSHRPNQVLRSRCHDLRLHGLRLSIRIMALAPTEPFRNVANRSRSPATIEASVAWMVRITIPQI